MSYPPGLSRLVVSLQAELGEAREALRRRTHLLRVLYDGCPTLSDLAEIRDVVNADGD